MIESLFRLLIIYLFFLMVVKVSEKKDVKNLSYLEMIHVLLLMGFSFFAYTKSGISFIYAMFPVLFLFLIEVVVSYFIQKNEKLKKEFGNQPILLIQDGKLNFKELSKLNYSLDTLFMKLKDEGVQAIEDVNYAVLEPNGTLAIFKNEGNDYPYPLILDGIINTSGLHEIGKDTKWLHHILKLRGVTLSDVFYAFQKNNHTFVIKKEEMLQK